MPVANRHTHGDDSPSTIQALMCLMGADPPGYFATVPRQPIGWAIHDPELPAPVRVVEFMRFHTVCYEGVPKNAHGEAQYSPYCVGVDGKRLNQRDCARETGLSTSVVKRVFDVLRRGGYVKIKKDGSIWYCGKVELRGEAAVRLSVAECLHGPANRAADQLDQGLKPLVTGRVLAASLLKAAQAFPAADQPAVEAHLLEVARWERAEIARAIARVRQDAERRYQAPVWRGYRLKKVGRTWLRMPAQGALSGIPEEASAVSTEPTRSAPEQVFISAASMLVPNTPGQTRGGNPPMPEAAPPAADAASSASAQGQARPWVAQSPAAIRGCCQHEETRRPNSTAAAPADAEPFAAPRKAATGSPELQTFVPEKLFGNSSPPLISQYETPARAENPPVPPTAAASGGVNSSASANSLSYEERQETKTGGAAATVCSHSGNGAAAAQAAPSPVPAGTERMYAQHIRQVFAGTGKGVPTDGQIREALAHLPRQATPEGFAGFIRSKLPNIRHAGAVVKLAQEYAHEIQYAPRATVFRCGQCHDQGFVLGDGQYCGCPVGLRRRQGDERRSQGTGP
jgi:hypothetical protein